MQGPLPDPNNPSLGQVAQPAQTPTEDDALVEKYARTLGAVTKLMQPMMLQRATPPEHQSMGHLLGSIFTMGMLPLQEHEQAARYNAYADQHNQALMLHAGAIARELVSADEHGKLEDLSRQLQMLNTQMGMARLNLAVGQDRYKRMRDATVPMANTPEGLQMQSDLGLTPSADFPGRLEHGGGTRLQRTQEGGWAMPGSPLAQAGAPTPTGTQAEAPTSDLGEVAQRAQKRQTQQKVEQQTAAQNAKANADMERNMQIFESWLSDPKTTAAINALPKAALGPVGGVRQWAAEKGILGSQRQSNALQLALSNTNALTAFKALIGGSAGGAGAMRAASLLKTAGLGPKLEELQTGRMPQSEAQAFVQTVLDRFKAIRQATQSGDVTSTPATTTTPTTLQTRDTSPQGTGSQTSTGKRYIMIEP